MRSLLVIAVCTLLAGCANSRQVEEQEALDPALSSAKEALDPAPSSAQQALDPALSNAKEALDPAPSNAKEALAQCRYAHPDEITHAVARAACVNKATELLRPMLPFPDLLDQEIGRA